MEKIDKKIEAVKMSQDEMEHRTDVEMEAVRLICKGEYKAANTLLATLDDSIVKEGINHERTEN